MASFELPLLNGIIYSVDSFYLNIFPLTLLPPEGLPATLFFLGVSLARYILNISPPNVLAPGVPKPTLLLPNCPSYGIMLLLPPNRFIV